MAKKLLFGLIVVLAAGGAYAILPPDASVREPEIRAHRIQVKKAYEERIKKRQELATREYEKATAAIGVPPWELEARLSGKPSKREQETVQRQQLQKNKTQTQILVSIVLFIIIGCVVWWVRRVTHEEAS